MNTLIQILPETVLLAAIAGAIQLVTLAFRNPFRPDWLRRDWVGSAAAIAIAAAISLGLGVMVTGVLAAGFGAGAAVAFTLAIGFAAAYAIWRGFGVGERLRRADAGQSPFAGFPGAGLLARGSRTRFGKAAGV